MSNRILSTASAAVFLVLPATGAAQAGARSGPALLPPLPDSAVLADLVPRNIGPAVMSGRISDIAVASEPGARPGTRLGRVVYTATAGGGVWKTENGGKTWRPVFEHEGSGSTGAVAVAPSDPDIVWVGSGESNNLRSSSWGDGIYKSTDAGATWTHMGLRGSQHIARIVVHPTDPAIVYVAAMGPLWAAGGERGLFRTTDGGRTWTNVRSFGPTTGVTDVALDPSNPDVVYAAAYQRERRSYSFVAGGPESGIWKSTDAGATWRELTNGLPTGDMGRIGISIARARPQTLYATIHAQDGGIFRTDDGGETWRRTSTLASIPWFFGQIRADPLDPERVYFLGQASSPQVSEDGGRTFRGTGSGTHADQHAMWIDPNDPNFLIIGNDGGLYVSHDRGVTWDFALNLPVSTFYAIGVDMREPFYWIYGGLQDNGSWGGPSQTRARTGIANSDWVRAGGGDGFYAAIDPTDPNVVYVESQNGALRRVDILTGEGKSIRPVPGPGERHRYNWSAPLLISPHDHNTLWFGANYLFRSPDRGDSWERVSDDLTRALDRDTLPIMGLRGPGGLGRHDGTAVPSNLATIDESRIRPGLLWTGSDDGVVAVSRDGGRAWTRFERFPGVPELTYVSRVIASQHAEGTAYVTLDGHRGNDFRPYVLKTTDFGGTWTSIAANLPENSSVQVIREHHRNPDLLFVGTEHAVWVSVNGGQAWARLRNFPTVAVHDLIIHPRENDLVIGSHGRGIWVLDDIGPLERLAEAARAPAAYVAPPRPATIFNPGPGPSLPGDRDYSADNPPRGALISYLVKPGIGERGRAALVISDADGRPVRELTASERPGLHRVVWDLRYGAPGAAPPAAAAARGDEEEEEEQGGGRGGRGGGVGPYVLPGEYTVGYRGGRGADPVVPARLTVRRDPLVRLTDAQYAELHAYRMNAYETAATAAAAVRELEEARGRIRGSGADSLAASPVNALVAEIDSVLVSLRGPRVAGGGRGGRGGGGGGGGGRGGQGAPAQGIQQRAQSALGEIATLHFVVTAEQKRAIDAAAADLERERARIDALRSRIPAGIGARGGERVPAGAR